ncbi:MAG: glycerol-3-phosphate dehydrogenase [Gammaproteobacteria bacterium]|nr:glycerol-3-phosphate dehydrogenase [Gammaproteobacteria bacterium]MBU2675930.1 glycerol-3-phosphate dehydrogenase [Gammaproteobacteria bacterium]NNC56721.1 glycerol-3-phosphate dehydrogenase [Woeseiaceae bacterium]NNL49666.1 glycerol-3-phosphate dehydrogenase [Woeseiaceae bacterium]
MSSERRHFDVAIVGAGINGAGIARDAALRGLSVVIFDKDDMCTGCSWISSRLIHGGLRYLEYAEIPLVYESLHERRCLRLTAEHLVKPLRICIPIFKGARRGPLLIRLGMIAYDLLSVGKLVPGHEMLSGDAMRKEEPGLRSEGLRAAARYYDAQIKFAERLVLENLLSARSAGAEVMTHCEVTSIKTTNGTVSGVAYVDKIDNATHEVSVGTLVNAAGPWVDRVLQTAPVRTERHIGGTKGSHIIVGKFEGAPQDAFYVEAAADGRPFFILPWNDQYLIGTTDIRYDGDLDKIRVSAEEVDYLLSETNRVFPAAKLAVPDIHYAYAGVRPLPFQKEGPESAITRRHIIKVNDKVADGLISIIGGKLTTYRNLAEQTVDRIAKLRHLKLNKCQTRDTLLPGAPGQERAREQLGELQLLSPEGIERVLCIYGGRASAICELCASNVALAVTLDSDVKVLAAEVVFAIREEFARSLEDIVFRRMMIGLDADQGRPMYPAVADIAAEEIGWDAAEKSRQLDELVEFSESLRVS